MAVDWETCSEEGCKGVAVGTFQCVAHGPEDLLDWSASTLDLRGVPLTRGLLGALLGRTPRDADGRPVLEAARFEHAVFLEDADFRQLRFPESVSFANARFEGEAAFDGAQFASASFDGATFARAATFDGARFGRATFRDAEFRDSVEMTKVTLDAGADFRHVRFGDAVRISLTFAGAVSFDEARFRGLTDLSVKGLEDLDEISFDDVLCEGQLDAFLSASMVTIQRSRVDRGGHILVPRGIFSIEGRLARPTLLEGGGTGSEMTELLSLGGSDVSGTTLSGFDLRETRFARVHGLDGLRIDGPPRLRRTEGFQTRRLKIADEDDARDGSKAVAFAEVAAIYRDLRAGQEGRKDEPGSADFYYGEMEMRRLGAPRLSAMRAILEAYRVTSGYGLRASRSLATLAILVVAAAIAFQTWLIEGPPRFAETLLFSLRSTVSFVREPTLPGMTLAAEYVQLVLRFAGPVLLALTVLAIRARVRR